MVGDRAARVHTTVPQQNARKNYIGIVSDTTEEERIADTALRAQPHVVSYLVGRLAAVLKRPRQGRTGTPALVVKQDDDIAKSTRIE